MLDGVGDNGITMTLGTESQNVYHEKDLDLFAWCFVRSGFDISRFIELSTDQRILISRILMSQEKQLL